jgi:uncharacterized membrane protein
MDARTGSRSLHVASAGHAAYAAIMIALGIQGFIKGDFGIIWQGVPDGLPGSAVLAYVCAFVSLASGIGLLFRRTAAYAAGALLTLNILWFLAWRVHGLIVASLVEGTWSSGETLVMMAGAWVLFDWFATDWDRRHFPWATGGRGLRIARVLYGVGLIPFGYAHFAYIEVTADLVPGWIPWHLGWAWLTGVAFVVAGVAIVVGVCARLAAVLSVWQMGLFFVLVWIPKAMAGGLSPFQWGEFASNLALVAAGWVVADSYRGAPWLVASRPSEPALAR